MKIENVIIIGVGTMGQGIAQWFLQQNVTVEMVDHNYDFALQSLETIKSNLDHLVAKSKIKEEEAKNLKHKISVKKLEEVNKNADLVIEAIIEDKEIKKELFKKLDTLLSPTTIIASNTSSFPITELSSAVGATRKMRFIGLHFFNPATIMKLVEVIAATNTDPDMARSLKDWFNQNGKVACLCTDAPGFIVNRVARNFYGEALRCVGNYNHARISEVDLVMRNIGGFKMGPFELMDLIGIDINLSVTESIYKAFFDEARFKPHRLQKEMVTSGRLGRKTQIGFYRYDK